MDDQKLKYRNSQAASETGSAISAPRAKLPLRAESRLSTSNAPSGSFIASQPSRSDQGLILSNSAACKDALARTNERSHAIVPHSRLDGRCRSIGAQVRRRILRASALAGDLWLIGQAVRGSEDRKRPGEVIHVVPEAGQVRQKRLHRFGTGWQCCMIVALIGVSRPAHAQAPEVITPIDLFDPENGQGVRLGEKLVFMPRLEIDGTYDSNIYNTDQGEVDDLVASIRPRFVLKPDLARHGFVVSGGADIRRDAEISAENSEQYDIGANAFFDFADRTALIVDGRYDHGIEERGTSGDQFFSDRPIEYDRIEAGALLRRTGGFLEMLGEIRASEIDYEDATLNGVPIDLSDRDASVRRARVRASAPSSDHTRIFVEGTYNQVRYENPGPISRNSDGFTGLVGMHLLLTELIDIEAGAGYISQKFDNPALDNVSDVNYHLLVNWTPRPDIEVTGGARRTVQPSPREDVAAIIRSDFSLKANKAFGDRVLATAEVGVVDEKYQGFSGSDQRYYARLGAQYRLTSNIGLTANVGWRKQDGGSTGRDYSGIAATIGVRMYL